MAEAVFVMALGRPVPKHLPLDSYGEGLNLKPVEGWKPIISKYPPIYFQSISLICEDVALISHPRYC